MNLSLSCRIAEGFLSKEEATLTFEELADLAVAAGYGAICMRASQIGVETPEAEVRRARDVLDERGLGVSMVSGDFDVVYNNERAPAMLRDIGRYLDFAEALGAPMIRVCLKTEEDIAAAQAAADEAAERGLGLVHQCHIRSLFETVDEIVRVLEVIGRENFGLIYEAANLEQCGQDYGVETIRRLAPWMRNVYLQNQRLGADGAITLETWCVGAVAFDVIEIDEGGGIDFAEVMRGLREIGYEGPVTVHQSAPEDEGMSSLEAAQRTAAFLNGL
ncbi:MAG: sugar phosphate isomerase/epimerase [Verrucomicrobiota bacterium]